MTLADPGGASEISADGVQHRTIRDRRLGTSAGRWRRRTGTLLLPPPGVERRTGNTKPVTDTGNAVDSAGARRDRGRHYRDLRRAKGPTWPTRARKTSLSIVSSPIRFIAAASSSFSGSTSRLRPTLQRWPGASPLFGPALPVESVDGPRPPSLPTGPTTTDGSGIISFMSFIPSRFHWTISCPKKPGPAQWLVLGRRGPFWRGLSQL